MDEAQVRELIVAAIGDGHHEFGSFFLSRFFGMAVSYEADACIVSLDVKPYMFNPQGSLHGGVLATALDISMGHLLKNRFCCKDHDGK
jgi:acyl-coenzyme A thioesterase PaaI-like protein